VLSVLDAFRDIAGQGAKFQDRAPWWGGDLQTLRNVVMRRSRGLPGRSSTLEFPMNDGSGDRLGATLHEPDVPPKDSPLVVLIHGLTGCEDSDYMRESARFHLARGRAVLRLNLRGAGPAGHLASNYYHAGCAADIQGVLEGLYAPHTQHGLFLVGYSLGGNVLLNWLGRGDKQLPVVGAATVSAPIEPWQACQRMMEPRNALYHHFLIQRMKRDVLSFLGPIAVPTLMIHARNDPWIPAEPYLVLKEHDLPQVEILLSNSGGHLGFHARGAHETWHDRTIDRYIWTLTGRDATAEQ